MLDTTKVQTQLRTVSDERDRLQRELQSQTTHLNQLQLQNETLQDQVSSIESEKASVFQQYQETQVKLKTITEYFEQKEAQLHRKIGNEEMVRQKIETQEAQAKERADIVEQEREKER